MRPTPACHALIIAATTALIALLAPKALATQPTAAPGPRPVPDPDPAIAARLEDLAGQLEELKSVVATKPAEGQPEPGPQEQARRDAAQKLLDAVGNYDLELKDFRDIRSQLQNLNSEQGAKEFADQIATIQQSIEQISRQRVAVQRRSFVSSQDLEDAQKELSAAKTDLAARMEGQNKRNQRLSQFSTTRQELQEQVQRLQAEFLETAPQLDARISAATDDTERSIARFKRRLLELEVEMATIRLERLVQENQRDKKAATQAQQRIDLLQSRLTKHEQLLETLEKIRNRSEIENARARADQIQQDPDSFTLYERRYWPLRLDILNALQTLTQFKQSAAYASRFPEDVALDLQSDQVLEAELWQQFVDSLDRRDSTSIRERYRMIENSTRKWRRQREVLQFKYDQTFDDRVVIGRQIDDFADRIREAYAKIGRPPADAGQDLVLLADQLKVAKEDLEGQSTAVLADLRSLSDRLNKANQSINRHIDLLADVHSQLYWSYLVVRQEPFWEFRWGDSLAEWRRETPLRTATLQDLHQDAAGVSVVQWILGGVSVAIALAAGVWLRRRCFGIVAGLESRITSESSSDGDLVNIGVRYHFNFFRLMGRILPFLLPAAAVLVFAQTTPLDGRVLRTAAFFVVTIQFLLALNRLAFRITKPRFRLFSCSNVVAKYYRQRLRLLVWFSAVTLPIPVLLVVFDWLPSTRQYLWSAYMVLVLVWLLLFMVRKNTVLRVFGRPDDASTLFALVASGYWLLVLAVLALIVAQTLGYSALTGYIVRGIAASFFTIIAAWLVVQYLNAMAMTYLRKERPEKTEPAATAGEEAEEVVLGENDTLISLGLLRSMLRWSFGLACGLLILKYWGVSWHQLARLMDVVVVPGTEDRPPITSGRVLLAILVLVLGVAIARSIRSVMIRRAAEPGLDRGARAAVATLINYVVIFAGLYFSLYVMRIPLGALTVVLGTLGLGIGLGLQPIFLNFVSGLIMLFERHIKIGDRIEIDGVLGEVTNLSVRSTTIKTFDNVDLVIPNADFINSKVVNWTLHDSTIRGTVDVGVAYGSKARLVERLLMQVARESPLVISKPEPVVRFMNFGESSLDFRVYVWFKDSADRWEFLTKCRYRIIELFEEHGIDIPFPQRTLSTVGGAPIPVRLAPEPDPGPSGPDPQSQQSAPGLDPSETAPALRSSREGG